MHKPKTQQIPVTLKLLNKKLDFEVKRLVREKEEGIVKHVLTKTNFNGISILTFKDKDGKGITLFYRHDESGTLRFAREKQFARVSPDQKQLPVTHIGRGSKNISS